MTKKEKILKKIKEACPELMELSFGCEVRHSSYRATCICIGLNGAITKEHIIVPKTKKFGGMSTYHPLGFAKCEIIGHEPELRHLLRIIKENDISLGLFHGETSLVFDDNKLGTHYNLQKSLSDNLDNTAFCDFIYELICKEK